MLIERIRFDNYSLYRPKTVANLTSEEKKTLLARAVSFEPRENEAQADRQDKPEEEKQEASDAAKQEVAPQAEAAGTKKEAQPLDVVA
jgi:hypothetical protein